MNRVIVRTLCFSAIIAVLLTVPRTYGQRPEPHEHSHAAHSSGADHNAMDEAFLREVDEYDEAPRPQSMLMWYYNSLGIFHSLVIPLAGLIAFGLSVLLVVRGGPYAGSALVFTVSLPLMVGLYAAITGVIMTLNVIADTEGQLRPRELAEGVSMSLVASIVALWMTAPAFLVAWIGSVARTLCDNRDQLKG